ncbi:hypothetical protein Plhal304r1_c017g0061491 [Plasmopara halstedii]
MESAIDRSSRPVEGTFRNLIRNVVTRRKRYKRFSIKGETPAISLEICKRWEDRPCFKEVRKGFSGLRTTVCR